MSRLEAFEIEMTTLRANEPLPDGGYNARHYCRVHHHLFQDVYTWAGKYRTVRTSKGGNPFCFPKYIAAERVLISGSGSFVTASLWIGRSIPRGNTTVTSAMLTMPGEGYAATSSRGYIELASERADT